MPRSFQFVHDAGGAGVAQAETALHERDAGLLLAADDLDALLDQVFVLAAAAALLVDTVAGLLQLLVNLHFVSSACPVWR